MRVLKSEALDRLISNAVMQANWKLDPRAKGELVIQSISPKQAPRR